VIPPCLDIRLMIARYPAFRRLIFLKAYAKSAVPART